MITIVDNGGANIFSIQAAIHRLGKSAQLSDDPERIKQSSHIILPGVGTAGMSMACLKQKDLDVTLKSLTQPVLGICLGLQLLFDYSQEDDIECLGLIPGKVQKLSKKPNLSIPHMGWNTLNRLKKIPLLQDISENTYVYFIHSYAAPINEYTCATSLYGDTFSAVVQRDNFYGTQFHPERSSKIGSQILKNFLEL